MPTARPVTQIPETYCPHCCYLIVAAAGGTREPRGGDILVCRRYGYAMELNQDLIASEPSAAVLTYIASKLRSATAN
jgi:hypothetical protein